MRSEVQLMLRDVPIIDDVGSAVTEMLGRLPGVGVVNSMKVRPNAYMSRSRSWLIDIETSEVPYLQVFCKAGPGQVHNAIGDECGIDYEASVYRDVLDPWDVAAPRCLGWMKSGRTGWSYLLLQALESHLRVDKGSYPGAIIAAAAWLGRSHGNSSHAIRRAVPPSLNWYRAETFRRWMSNALESTKSARLRRIAMLERKADLFGQLAGAETTLVHGDCYPDNVLVRANDVRAVDWEWAGLGPGEIDLAALTEAWSDDVVRSCVTAYSAARWPDGPKYNVAQMVARARVYLFARWLGGQPVLRDDPDDVYLRAMEGTMGQLGLRT